MTKYNYNAAVQAMVNQHKANELAQKKRDANKGGDFEKGDHRSAFPPQQSFPWTGEHTLRIFNNPDPQPAPQPFRKISCWKLPHAESKDPNQNRVINPLYWLANSENPDDIYSVVDGFGNPVPPEIILKFKELEKTLRKDHYKLWSHFETIVWASICESSVKAEDDQYWMGANPNQMVLMIAYYGVGAALDQYFNQSIGFLKSDDLELTTQKLGESLNPEIKGKSWTFDVDFKAPKGSKKNQCYPSRPFKGCCTDASEIKFYKPLKEVYIRDEYNPETTFALIEYLEGKIEEIYGSETTSENTGFENAKVEVIPETPTTPKVEEDADDWLNS